MLSVSLPGVGRLLLAAKYAPTISTRPIRSIPARQQHKLPFQSSSFKHEAKWESGRTAASSSDDPSVEGGSLNDENFNDSVILKTIERIKTFFNSADPATKALLLLLIPLTFFVSQSLLWKSLASTVTTSIAEVFAPFTEWFTGSVLEIAKYRMLQVFSLPTTGKLWAVLGIGTIATFVGGAAYRIVAGTTWSDALGKSYFTLNNVPGMDCTTDGTLRSVWVLNLIHVMSLFTFAILVGILTDDIGQAVERVQKGNFPVPEKDHTVLLGWNSQTIPVLAQIMRLHEREPNGVFSMPILILADKDKEYMDNALLDEFGPKVLGKKILTRHGGILRKCDVERVAAGQARTIMFLSHEGENDVPNHLGSENQDELEAIGDDDGGQYDGQYEVTDSAKLLAALAHLKTLGADEKAPQNLVFQSRLSEDKSFENDFACSYMLKSFNDEARPYRITMVYDMKSLTDVMAQCASQPGLANVFKSLFERTNSKDDPNYMIAEYPALEGKTFGEVRRIFTGHVAVCGVLGRKFEEVGQTGLNPPDHYVVEKGDRLILLTLADKASVVPMTDPRPRPVLPKALQEGVHAKAAERNYVVIAHCGDPSQLVEALIESIEQEEVAQSSITVLTGHPWPDAPKATRKVKVKYMDGDLSQSEIMIAAGVETADSVVVQLITDYSPAEADAQVLSSLLLLHAVLEHSEVVRETPLGVVCNINDPEVLDVINAMVHAEDRQLRVDCIEPDKLLGGILTQVAYTPDLREVFEDLFDADGNELYAKPLAHYGLKPEGQLVEWQMLQELTRTEGDLLVGYVDRDERVQFAIPHDTMVRLEDGDRFVVLAEDMY